jgi:hypothetical protein
LSHETLSHKPIGDTPVARRSRGVRSRLLIAALLLIGGCLYFEAKHPHLSGLSPVSVTFRFSDETVATITNRDACAALLEEFRQAQWNGRQPKAMGAFTIQYDNGKTDVVYLLPEATIRFANNSYGISSTNLLEKAGVDTTKMAEYVE